MIITKNGLTFSNVMEKWHHFTVVLFKMYPLRNCRSISLVSTTCKIIETPRSKAEVNGYWIALLSEWEKELNIVLFIWTHSALKESTSLKICLHITYKS